ncbi:phosphonate transport system substrate-binding protein [Desulfocicer vacuolatum DSM 3385]|uniref:Phosphonate transport system substrate-binding protein n=1 Tax=Desulfocicer vacuolatum DSM 3385 TaxID=1121400 RepID=A0A1W2DBF0_9BACT|nr:phosphate/phosphite/phosphonate ABC transporter substrate-binding protein [Desulfocicer vacuolatum]SMC94790.1 phosphonate transport system substrate-binding protein [Desulfocicer vacuolatum DSM 3385]
MKIICLFLFSLLICPGCGDDEPAIKVDLKIKEQVIRPHEPDVITYAYLPQYSHTVSYTRHHLLVSYLRKKTGLNIKQIFPDTFDHHMCMVGENKIDISFSNPFVYVKMARKYGAKAFARSIEASGRENFRGQIICRKDNVAIKNLSHCVQKRWIAVDSTSAAGFLYPLGFFLDHGIEKSDFKEIAFAPGPGGKQEKVILAVYAGKYDIGTIREGALDVVVGKIDLQQIRILAMTAPYPGWVYAARKDLDTSVVEKIQQAFKALDMKNATHERILKAAHFAAVISSTDSNFDSVRELVTKTDINLTQ